MDKHFIYRPLLDLIGKAEGECLALSGDTLDEIKGVTWIRYRLLH